MIRQFEVYTHPSTSVRVHYPYVLILQHDSVPLTHEVVAAPLVLSSLAKASRRHPLLRVRGNEVILMVPLLSPVSRRLLGRHVAEVGEDRDRIVAALDLLFVGS